MLRNIEKVNLQRWMSQRHHPKAVVASCAAFVALMYTPHFFQFRVHGSPCDDGILANITGNAGDEVCYRHELSCVTDSPVWVAYGWVFQAAVKFLPTVTIFWTNVVMVSRLRRVWRKRKEVRENNSQSRRRSEDFIKV